MNLSLFIFALSILLLVAVAAGSLARWLKLPAVIGELLAGIMLGPTLFGQYFPATGELLFSTSGPLYPSIDALVKVGGMLLLFVIGLEVKLAQIIALKRTIISVSLCGFIVPFVLGMAAVFLAPRVWDYPGGTDKWLLPLFIGTALSISSLPVIARILADMGVLKSRTGSIILSSATIDDLIGWLVFGVIVASYSATASVSPAMTILIVLGMCLFSLTLGQKLAGKFLLWNEKQTGSSELFLSIALVIVLLTAAFAEKIGSHATLGAFLVGVAFSNTEGHKMHAALRYIVIAFFSPLYFISVGLQVNFFANFDFTLVAIVILIATAGKVLGVFAGARIAGVDSREALAIAFGMNARGAVGIILATSAYQAMLVSEEIFVALIVMAMVTTVLSGPLMKKALAGIANTQP